MRFSPKCSEKSLSSVNAKFVSVGYIFLINNQNWIHVVSDITLHVHMTPRTAEDRLLINTSPTEKGWIIRKITVEFPV